MEDNIEFEIKTFEFNKETADKLWDGSIYGQYPFVYILNNGKDIYVGQSRREERVDEHLKDDLFKTNSLIHVITGDFNVSAVLDFEALLIRLMEADGLFNMTTNTNKTNFHRFREKQEYDQVFKMIWDRLQDMKLVRENDYSMLLHNSDLYKYSPCTALNPEQLFEMDHIINTILAENVRPYIITGIAGTGKTVMATALFYKLKKDERFKDLEIALVVPTPTRETIKKVIGDIDGFHKNQVIGPTEVFNKKYDILICDEVHKLRRYHIRNQKRIRYLKDELNDDHLKARNGRFKDLWEKRKITNFMPEIKSDLMDQGDELDLILWAGTYQILFYDDSQRTNPDCLNTGYVTKRNSGYKMIQGKLTKQMRVDAGDHYMQYINDMLSGMLQNKMEFPKYEFVLYTSFADMAEQIKKLNEKYGLCRLCAGYAWPWDSKDSNEAIYDIDIDGYKIKWNGKTNGWIESPNSVNEMGSIYSIHGFDLNYAGVVIAGDLRYDREKQEIVIDPEHFMDPFKRKVKAEELKAYIINTYKVLLSRGIKGTFVYVCDDDLREYLKNFIKNGI